MASFTDVGDSVSISTLEKDTPVVVNISGTYDMVIAVQREVRGGSGAFEEVERYTAANAVVEDTFWSDRPGQKFQLIVLSDTSGTATATIEIGQILGQAPDVAHTHTLSDITDAGTAAAADIGTGPGDIPVLDGSGRMPAVDGSQLTNLPAGASNDVVDVANAGTLTLGALNRVASAATVTVPNPATNTNKVFGVFLAKDGAAGSLAGGLTLTLDEPNRARTYASDGTTWNEYFGAAESGSAGPSTPNEVRLTGGTEATTLAKYNDALVFVDSGTQTITAPASDEGAYYFRGINNSGNVLTIGGVSIPDGEVFSALVDGTTMTARNVW